MTATEVLERAAEMARVLGATYGRLQSELLSPLVTRARGILARRGEIPDLPLDNRMVASSTSRLRRATRRSRTFKTRLSGSSPSGRSVRTRWPRSIRRRRRAGSAVRLGVPGELIREGPAVAERARSRIGGGAPAGEVARRQARRRGRGADARGRSQSRRSFARIASRSPRPCPPVGNGSMPRKAAKMLDAVGERSIATAFTKCFSSPDGQAGSRTFAQADARPIARSRRVRRSAAPPRGTKTPLCLHRRVGRARRGRPMRRRASAYLA